jgi:hypothetical protein
MERLHPPGVMSIEPSLVTFGEGSMSASGTKGSIPGGLRRLPEGTGLSGMRPGSVVRAGRPRWSGGSAKESSTRSVIRFIRTNPTTMEDCNGKRTYRSETEAKRIRNIREKDVSHMRVYQCPFCWGWHLTSARTTDPIYNKMKKASRYKNE